MVGVWIVLNKSWLILFEAFPNNISCFVVYMYTFFNREYVVDLVGEPGNVHGPDSSINGGLLSSMPSPFKISHLKEFQQPHVDVASSCQILNSEHMCDPPKNPLYSGKLRFVYFGSLFFNKSSVKGQLIELWWRHKCNYMDTLRCVVPNKHQPKRKRVKIKVTTLFGWVFNHSVFCYRKDI